MATTLFTQAFAKFGATLANPNWAVSAKAPDGSIVISCWLHRLLRAQGTSNYCYRDLLSRFRGNVSGTNLLREHLLEAQNHGTEFRLIVARVLKDEDVARIERGDGADKVKKTFAPKPEFVGQLQTFDGDEFSILFRPAGAPISSSSLSR